METDRIVFEPQTGKQTAFMASSADVVFYGGAAGAGKTMALLIEALRHVNNGLFGVSIFRRSSPQIRTQGGLWEEAQRLYKGMAKFRDSKMEIEFPSGMKIKFCHMLYEHNKYDYQGAQIGLLCFDELQNFTQTQFSYLWSRNRSSSGIVPYIRCTCNPIHDSWIKNYIDWWLKKDGFPDEDRSGVVRWVITIGDNLFWTDTEEEAFKKYGEDCGAKSFTFVSANIFDNPKLLEVNPEYLANLRSMVPIERRRLLEGNWKLVAQRGDWFSRDWVEIVDIPPVNSFTVRYWDRAASEMTSRNRSPDATVGLKMCYVDGGYYILDMIQFWEGPHMVKQRIIDIAKKEPFTVCVLAQDPGQAGKAEAAFLLDDIVQGAPGCEVRLEIETKDKLTRYKSFSSIASAKRVKVVRGHWNESFFAESESFGTETQSHDDVIDGTSGAFNFIRKRLGDEPMIVSC